MLWWAAAASVPIAIHLLSRRRYRRVPWAAMDFLERAFKRTRRRLRIENLLLMLLRVAILLFLAFALAGPRLEGSGLLSGVGGTSKHVVFVVDTSFSMDARDQRDESPFAKAKQTALQILEGLDPDGDSAALITTGAPAHLVLPLTREVSRVRRTLEELEVSSGATDTLGGLKVVSGLLQEPGLDEDFPGRKTVYVLTDMQKAPLLDAAVANAEDGESILSDAPDPALEKRLREISDSDADVIFVDVGLAAAEAGGNVAVTALEHRGKALVRGLPTRFECRVRNFGDATTTGELRFFVDGESSFVQRERVTGLKGRDTGTDAETEIVSSFTVTFESPGWHYVAVRYVDDVLKIDNVRRRAVYVRDRIRVLAVNGATSREVDESTTFFVARALDPFLGRGHAGTRFSVTEVPLVDLQGEEFDKYDLVIMADVPELGASKAEELENFVREGGGLLYFCGPNLETGARIGTRGGTTNDIFFREGEGLLPARLVRPVGSDQFTDRPYQLQFETFEHPAVEYFEDPKIRPGVTRMPVHRFIDARIDAEDDAVTVLASFRLGTEDSVGQTHPAIIERRFGGGSVFLITTSADKSWNIYGATPAFVPLMKEIAFHITRRRLRANLTVGDALVLRFHPSVSRVEITDGDDPPAARSTSIAPDGSAAEVAVPRLTDATILDVSYDVSTLPDDARDDGGRRIVVVNVDPEESDLARCSRDWMTTHFGTELFDVVDSLEEIEETARSNDESHLWRAILYAVLAFLLLETAAAWFFGSKQNAEVVAS